MWANMLELADIDSKSQSTQVETADIRSIRVSLKRDTLKAKQLEDEKRNKAHQGVSIKVQPMASSSSFHVLASH
jgi:hypothetical protein